MADKRMFSKTVVDSDAFLDMPLSTQALYFHFGMRADDDGFVNGPKKIQKMISASEDDIRVLIAKGFIIPFDSGVIVIKHWKIHNTLKADRYKPTVYQEEMTKLETNPNKSYTLALASGTELEPSRNHSGTELEPQRSIDKKSIGERSIGESSKPAASNRKRFSPPTLEELSSYISEKGYTIDPQRFMDHYESIGWKVGRNPMKDWRAAVRTWGSREQSQQEVNRYGKRSHDGNAADGKVEKRINWGVLL